MEGVEEQKITGTGEETEIICERDPELNKNIYWSDEVKIKISGVTHNQTI
jgi:hypothetical protein